MAYQLFERTAARVESPALSMVPDGRIALNSAAARLLSEAGVTNVVLLWDKSAHKVALRAAAKGDRNGYAVSLAPDKHSGSLRAKTFMSHIGWEAPKRTTVPAAWNAKERMLEAILPPEYLRRKVKFI